MNEIPGWVQLLMTILLPILTSGLVWATNKIYSIEKNCSLSEVKLMSLIESFNRLDSLTHKNDKEIVQMKRDFDTSLNKQKQEICKILKDELNEAKKEIIEKIEGIIELRDLRKNNHN